MATCSFALVLCLTTPVLAAAPQAAADREMVLVEAESFRAVGGWVVDQQFMDQMGSPFLLAHGLGEPVKDAETTAKFPAAGRYRVLVRTRDWVAPHAPGKFKLLVDGKPLEAVFGTAGGGQWTWQDGGTVEIAFREVRLALNDLTGFEGRCDAILFVRGDEPYTPPDDPKAMAALRKRLLGLPAVAPEAGRFDLVVVGGGVAGCATAVSAARLGLKVALIQDRPVLGGNNSSEVKVHVVGMTTAGLFPKNAEIVKELGSENDALKLKVIQGESNVSLYLNHHAFAVEMDGPKIAAVVAKDTTSSQELRFLAPLVVDCTGDATVGHLAGADFRFGRESRSEHDEPSAPAEPDKTHMGNTCMWRAAKAAKPSTFPECPWAVKITDENFAAAADMPAPKPAKPEKPAAGAVAKPAKKPALLTGGGWNWESGFARDTITEAEYIRDHNFRAIYGTWDYLKNRAANRAEYADYKLSFVVYVAGKRESRRLLGDLILTENDIRQQKVYPDGCVNTNWSVDLHYPTAAQKKYFPDEEFRSHAVMPHYPSYAIPYRCLYSRNVPNLMMAGRNISVTHVALGTTRVQGTTGMMGVVVGRAAYLCKKHGCLPRDVYQKHLEEFKRLLANPDVVKRGDPT